jgi:hypothetical protein
MLEIVRHAVGRDDTPITPIMSARARVALHRALGLRCLAWPRPPGLAGGWDLGPAGRTHASAGPLSPTNLVTDTLEARQGALSLWDPAGDRFRSRETHRWLSRRPHSFAGTATWPGNMHGSRYRSLAPRTRPNWRWPTATLPNCEWLPATSRGHSTGPAALEVLDHQPDNTATTGVRVQAWNNLGCAEAIAGNPVRIPGSSPLARSKPGPAIFMSMSRAHTATRRHGSCPASVSRGA